MGDALYFYGFEENGSPWLNLLKPGQRLFYFGISILRSLSEQPATGMPGGSGRFILRDGMRKGLLAGAIKSGTRPSTNNEIGDIL
jgi:hypothetical protein